MVLHSRHLAGSWQKLVQVADGRTGEVFQRAAPLLDVLRVAPTRCLGPDVELGALGKTQHVVVGGTSGGLAGPFIRQRIDPLQDLLALPACLRSGLRL